jgi:hypothetical protein
MLSLSVTPILSVTKMAKQKLHLNRVRSSTLCCLLTNHNPPIVQEFERHADPIGDKMAKKKLPLTLRAFRNGIVPFFGDADNAAGGQWVVDLPPNTSAAAAFATWRRFVSAMMQDELPLSECVCGCVLQLGT